MSSVDLNDGCRNVDGLLEEAQATGSSAVSAAERRFWYLSKHGHGVDLSWPNALRLVGAWDHGALERAWVRLVARHDIIRTYFIDVAGHGPQRVVAPASPAAHASQVLTTDLSHLSADAVPAAVAQLISSECDAVRDLRSGPILRCRVVRLPNRAGSEQHLLVVTGHNAALDDWSVGLLWRDLGVLYRAETGAVAPDLPPVEVTCAQHAARQVEVLTASAQSLDRVRRRRAHLPVTRLATTPPATTPPATTPRQVLTGDRAHRTVRHFNVAAVRRLRDRVAVPSVSDFVLLFAVFAEAVADVLGRDDLTLGTSSAGRSTTTFNTLGYFANRFVVRVDRSGRRALAETVTRIRTSVYTELRDDALPFEYVLERCCPAQYTAPAPLVDVLFVLASELDAVDFGNLIATVEEVADPLNRFDLLTSVRRRGDEFQAAVHTRAGIDQGQAGAVLDRFTALLGGAPVSQLPEARPRQEV